ncbi:hypothetical protein BS47DRAFT_1364437 [Hydnum rufescens UP504]|uniref:Uncharacterized protein n=1 Tax=Hydnum rufescens UP504 TaxID=1448309 RepID=A0A9P6ARB3_9AGAM|nr:hypothetical protein BS47DRAFT_1364437 [Hydnum rufescens UP504]
MNEELEELGATTPDNLTCWADWTLVVECLQWVDSGWQFNVHMITNWPATGCAEHSLLYCISPMTHQQGHLDCVNGCDGNPWVNQDQDDHDTLGPIVSTGMFHMCSLQLSDESIILHMSQQASGIILPEFTAQQMARFQGQKTMVLSENDDSGELDDKEINLPEQFSTIWCSFPYQILRALPTPRGRHSLSVYHHFQENGGDDEEEEDPAPLDENWMQYMNQMN